MIRTTFRTSAKHRRCDCGTHIEYVGCDGGEPEDQTLGRDWAWVVGALNKEARRER